MSIQLSDILVTVAVIGVLFAVTAVAAILWKLCIGLLLMALGRPAAKAFGPFTLVELLALILILGSLTAMLPPSTCKDSRLPSRAAANGIEE